MAKFYGAVGYAVNEELRPGVWQDVIVELNYYGDVLRDTVRLSDGDTVNPDLSINNSFSIVADAYANEHFFAIRYIRWAGALWSVTDVEVKSPRLILRVGGVYNGQTASAPGTS